MDIVFIFTALAFFALTYGLAVLSARLIGGGQ